jgi:SNF2 family DNA or RNA helicase
MLRDLMSDVMIRHTRSSVQEVQLPPRRATTVRMAMNPAERNFYSAISNFVRSCMQNQTLERGITRLTLQTLQREIGSCSQSALPTLERLALSRIKDDEKLLIHELISQCKRIKTWSKADALVKWLRSNPWPQDKVILFTHFRRTLELLEQRLHKEGFVFVSYHGGLSYAQKQAAIEAFTGQTPLLLSTEAAGEGRNLQFSRIMLNFDLPWNPLRIEQRVGRIHRIGQNRPVEIINFSAEGTIEDYMLEILDRKLNMFELVIGEMDMILGHIQDDRDFEDIILDTWISSQSDEQVADAFDKLGQSLISARQAYKHAQEYDDVLFGDDFAADS